MATHIAVDARSSDWTPKPSELFRERQVARYFAAIPEVVDFDAATSKAKSSSSFVARSTSDPALSAFAQLAALRLNVARTVISLIDARKQYVIAEATKTLSLQSDQRHGPNDALSLGNVVFPRSRSISELLVEPQQDPSTADPGFDADGMLIIHDVQAHPRYKMIPKVAGTVGIQFYAGVPIVLPNGTKIGSFAVIDEQPHAALTAEERVFLWDMAKTTMDHLEAIRLRSEHQRRHMLVKGLESFIDGLTDPKESIHNLSSSTPLRQQDPLNRSERDGEKRTVNVSSADVPKSTTGEDIPLWERALPIGAKAMFSRAAKIIRQTGDYDGVVFFYMSSTSTGRRPARQNTGNTSSTRPSSIGTSKTLGGPPSTTSEESETSDEAPGITDPEFAQQRRSLLSRNACPILGASLCSPEMRMRPDGDHSFSLFDQRDLRRLLGKRPQGRTFVFNQHGQPLQGDSSGSGSSGEKVEQNSSLAYSTASPEGSDEAGIRSWPRASYIGSLQKLSRTGKAFVCLPIWDFERRRWFAYAVCWTSAPSRDPAIDGDLHFLRLFGHSIINALAHIDAAATNRARTAFVSSISHELRSPLHGILGAANFLQESLLNRFQREMVDAVSSSGRTLLDTIDHVMDFAHLNSTGTADSMILSDPKSSRLRTDSPTSPGIDIAALLEEVLDAVSMGFSVQNDSRPDELQDRGPPSSRALRSHSKAASWTSSTVQKHRSVTIAVEMEFRRIWSMRIPAGGWRRIVMNLFANALKYTTDGIIIVRLESLDNGNRLDARVQLSVIDTGCGMSANFAENHLFKPFTQEDTFAVGTGLGLSIVDQIVRDMGGKIHVTSKEGAGSTMKVSLPMHEVADAEDVQHSDALYSIPNKMQGIRICHLEDRCTDNVSDPQSVETQFSSSVIAMLQDWFGISVMRTRHWHPGMADLVLCVRPSFKSLEAIRAAASPALIPPVLIIACDALEMAALRTDARVSTEGSIVELICQPVGPRKLAKALERCLDRQTQTPAQGSGKVKEPAPTHIAPDVTASSNMYRPVEKPRPSEQASGGVASPGVQSDPCVLIVDDNPLNLRLLGAFLGKRSIPYLKAENGQEAVSLFQDPTSAIKCILMDISMPVMDGMTATRRIREFERASGLSRTPIVALTGLASTASQSEAVEAGMDDFLVKPVSFRVLQEKVPFISTMGSNKRTKSDTQ